MTPSQETIASLIGTKWRHIEIELHSLSISRELQEIEDNQLVKPRIGPLEVDHLCNVYCEWK